MGNARDILAASFLDKSGWSGATRTALAGDASSRQYERLSNATSTQTAILMNAQPGPGDGTAAFINVATHLHSLDFSPPKILSADPENGFLLLEDLGDDLFARIAQGNPQKEREIYEAAVDFLVELHRYPPPDFCKTPSAQHMAEMTALTFEYYAPRISTANKNACIKLLEHALSQHRPFAPVLALRDFHAENLIWLPNRPGARRIGLLDFQDAITCHPAYDLVSLTKDARRDLPQPLIADLMRRYITKTGHEADSFLAAAAAISTQRNLRILGIFARLALRDKKPIYIDLIPRVWTNLQQDLSHPSLTELRKLLSANLAPPTLGFLNDLRSQCLKSPHP